MLARLTLATALILLIGVAVTPARAQGKPNILVIWGDDIDEVEFATLEWVDCFNKGIGKTSCVFATSDKYRSVK